MDRIEYPPHDPGQPAVPHWFTYLVHWVNKRLYCRRGHTLTLYRSCNRCGEIVR